MFTEKNIPTLIFSVPFLGIFLTTLLFTALIINSEYQVLENDTQEIRHNYIEQEKKVLKIKIKEVLDFIKYSEFKDNKTLLKKSTLNYIENIINKDNGYIYIIDDKGIVISHPVLKKNFDATALKDKNGFQIANELIKTAKTYPEGSFLTYFWTKPKETIQKEKTAFIYYYQKWNWIISIGGYMDVVEEEIIKKVKKRETILYEEIKFVMLFSLALVFLILIFSYFFSKTITNIFRNYKRKVVQKEKELKVVNKSLRHKADDEVLKRSKKEKELEIAYKDNLTALPNRMKLSQLLKNSTSPKLALFNIDRFTDVNYYYSPKIADKLLVELAKQVKVLFKGNKNISIFKLPVDEYAIYSNSLEISEKKFLDICNHVIEEIEKKPFIIGENSIHVSLTTGVCLSEDNVIMKASSALKIAKKKQKRLIVYTQEDKLEINYQNNVKWMQVLKSAIKEDRIVVFAQRIVDNNDALIEKYECLIRIKDEEGEIIAPHHFLELSKKLKLYHQLTRIVIEKSFHHFSNSNAEFSVNLTLDDILNKETINFIKIKLENQDIAKRVTFEIVESEGIDNFDEVSLFIKDMQELGCKIAIDDFGTGYSNFEYLMKLNVDYIKIDGSFIKNIDICEQSLLISELILTFAQKQNIKTVAEFVHSKSVLEKVKELGIDYSQGYYYGKPTALEEL